MLLEVIGHSYLNVFLFLLIVSVIVLTIALNLFIIFAVISDKVLKLKIQLE
jgi:hypothetical protein